MTLIDAPAGGTAVDAIYRRAALGASCWTRNHRGQVHALPIRRWMGGPDTTAGDRMVDEYMLSKCTGTLTLDVGCGPGRFAAALARSGRSALGVDSSAAAVGWTRRRGGVAMVADLFHPLPGEGCWDRVLLADGNIGIGGDPVATLRRAAELLAPGGFVVVEVDPPVTAVIWELLRWETEHHVGQWFPWSRVGAGALRPVAHSAGLTVDTVVDMHSRVIAVLTPVAGPTR